MHIQKPIFDNDSVRTKLLFIMKSLPEILNLIKTKNIKLCTKSIPVKVYEDLIKTDNITDFSILYESLNDKHMLENIMIENEPMPSYLHMKYAFKIFDLVALDMINFRIKSGKRWHRGENILHIACWMLNYDTIVKIIKTNPELLIESTDIGTPISYFIMAMYNTKNLVENKYMDVIKSINMETYQTITQCKTSKSWSAYELTLPAESTIIDIINIIIASNNANKADILKVCNGIYDQLFPDSHVVSV